MNQAAQSQDAWQLGRHAIDFVLVQPSHPGNIGAAARAIQVMGFDRLTVVAPRHADATRHREAIAFASGATRVLEQCRVVDSLPHALAQARFTVAVSAAGREFAQPPREPADVARSILAVSGVLTVSPVTYAPVALVFGTERNGLSIEQAQLCHAVCSIASDPSYGSLNLAQAVQVLAYVIRQALLAHTPPAKPPVRELHTGDQPAAHAQLEGMFDHLHRILVAIEFLKPDQPKRLMPRLRNLFVRAGMSRTEVDIVRGICTQIDRKLTGKGDDSA